MVEYTTDNCEAEGSSPSLPTNLYLFIEDYLVANNIPIVGANGKSVVDLVLQGHRKSGWSAAGAWRFSKRHWPNKPRYQRLYNYILLNNGLKYCFNCSSIKKHEYFYVNNSKDDGLSSLCIICDSNYKKINSKDYARNTANYKASKLRRTPSWADTEKIKEVYDNCPSGHHVDHIVPLNGQLVSGLHVHYNLQYLTPSENTSKNNKFSV